MARTRVPDILGRRHRSNAVLGCRSAPYRHGTTASASAAAAIPPTLRHGSTVQPLAYPCTLAATATTANTATGTAEGSHSRNRMAGPVATQPRPTRGGQRRRTMSRDGRSTSLFRPPKPRTIDTRDSRPTAAPASWASRCTTYATNASASAMPISRSQGSHRRPLSVMVSVAARYAAAATNPLTNRSVGGLETGWLLGRRWATEGKASVRNRCPPRGERDDCGSEDTASLPTRPHQHRPGARAGAPACVVSDPTRPAPPDTPPPAAGRAELSVLGDPALPRPPRRRSWVPVAGSTAMARASR